MLDGLLHPHSSIPYVQMGRIIVLYTVSLLSRDSCGRVFIRQLISLETEEEIDWSQISRSDQ